MNNPSISQRSWIGKEFPSSRGRIVARPARNRCRAAALVPLSDCRRLGRLLGMTPMQIAFGVLTPGLGGDAERGRP